MNKIVIFIAFSVFFTACSTPDSPSHEYESLAIAECDIPIPKMYTLREQFSAYEFRYSYQDTNTLVDNMHSISIHTHQNDDYETSLQRIKHYDMNISSERTIDDFKILSFQQQGIQ